MIAVRGKLLRVSGIGAESTGWAIDLDKSLQVGDKRLSQLEINHDPSRWSKFENQHVEAKGQLTFREGIERGSWPVLDVEKMRKIG